MRVSPTFVVATGALVILTGATSGARQAGVPQDLAGQSILIYDQLNDPGPFSIVSTDFETANDSRDTQEADDFVVPPGEIWRIREVDAQGSYGSGQRGPADSMHVFFYADNAGLPGTLECSRPGNVYTGIGANPAIALSSPCVLRSGIHWVSVQGRMDSTAGGWFWTSRSTVSNSSAALINAGGANFPACTNWGHINACGLGSDYDMMFRLVGTTAPSVVGDFDGDGNTDFVVVRPPGPLGWYALGTAFQSFQWGNTDVGVSLIATGDYDGDARADAVACSDSPRVCYVRRSSDGGLIAQQWGIAGDISTVGGDYDGDGLTDFAAFRPSNSTWYIRRSSDSALVAQSFGAAGDRVAPGDYDHDGKNDFAVFRPSAGTFYLQRSTLGFGATQWGASGDSVVGGDFDGDDQTDLGVIRNVGGTLYFYIRQSKNGTQIATPWGLAGDQVAVGDYDGDGRSDIAVWRNGVFYIRRTINGALVVQPWGQAGDSVLLNTNVH